MRIMTIDRRISRNVSSRGQGVSRGGLLKAAKAANAGQLMSVFEQENMPSVVPNTYNSTKLLITNLDSKVSDNDVCELFSEIGIIREAAVHYNCWGYSLGTAHVVYLNHEHAAEAARRYNGIPLDGKPMTITLEGAPFGNQVDAPILPVKMRLSFGPTHNRNGVLRNPFSQVNRRGTLPKTPKRLGKGFKIHSMKEVPGSVVSRGGGRPGGRLARSRGRVLTAAELDLELDEYLSQSKPENKDALSTTVNETIFDVENQVIADNFYVAGQALEVGHVKTPKNTPGQVGRPKKTPGKTPIRKTPTTKRKSKTPAKAAKETPAKTANKTPAKTSTETPTTTAQKKTPAKTPRNTPAKTPKNNSETPKRAPAKSPKQTPNTPNKTDVNISSVMPARSTAKKTPGKALKQRKTPSVKVTQTNNLENKRESAVPQSLAKETPRRSGRVLKMD